MARDILVYHHMHWDPTWRRCFDRPAVYDGVTVRSYAEVEALAFERFRELAPRGFTFSEGQTAVWRKYFERHPEKREAMRELARTGRLTVMLAGEVVQDSVMPTAEGLVRNFLAAWPFYREFVGEDHPGLRIAWLEDAFGNSPNMPQILKLVGAESVAALTYRTLEGDVWVGIDGTRLGRADGMRSFFVGDYGKHPPCRACRGAGCTTCGGRGFVVLEAFDQDAVLSVLNQAAAATEDIVRVVIGSEEVPPRATIADAVEAFNRQRAGECVARFAGPVEVGAAIAARVSKAVAEHADAPAHDLNPAMPGCLVTHIELKQRTRALSYCLVLGEAELANRAWADGAPVAPPADLRTAWQRIAFCQFHDAITGTHIDSATAELDDMLDEAEAIADEHFTLPAPAREPRFSEVREFPATTRVGPFTVAFDRDGILGIERDGVDVFGTLSHVAAHQRPFRIGELVLEYDVGDAWGQRIPDVGGNLRGGVQLGRFHDRCWHADGALRWHGAYKGGDRNIARLEWTVTMAVSADGQRLDFVTDVDWDTRSRRLRVFFPVKSQDATATYEVPFGHIDRSWDASKMDFSQWQADQREFGTLHWVRKTVNERCGVAVLNKGLPCNRWAPGRLDLSLLRSPEWHFCVVEPHQYEFWDTDGQRDTGRHRFEYALVPYCDGLNAGDLTRMGYAYNLPAPLTPPFVVAGDVVVTAWKPAEAGDGWILRVQEAGGTGTELALTFKSPRTVTVTDLLERPMSAPSEGASFRTPLHRHGIRTLHIR